MTSHYEASFLRELGWCEFGHQERPSLLTLANIPQKPNRPRNPLRARNPGNPQSRARSRNAPPVQESPNAADRNRLH